VPDDQLVVCSGFALNRLNTSTKPAMRRLPEMRMPFSTRISAIVTLSPSRADWLDQNTHVAVVQGRREGPSERLTRLVTQIRRQPDAPW
jgi:hypothetical protein